MKESMTLEDQATQYQNRLSDLIDESSILQFLLNNKSISKDQFKAALEDLKNNKSIKNQSVFHSVLSIWRKYAMSMEYGYGESVDVFLNDHCTKAPDLY